MNRKLLLVSPFIIASQLCHAEAKQGNSTVQQHSIWQEFERMHDEFDQLHERMNDMFTKMFEGFESEQFQFKTVPQVEEKDNELIVRINLPDINPASLDVKIDDNVLRIAGSKEEQKEAEANGKKVIRRKQFELIRTLPYPVKVEATKATYENSTLTITMPKEQVKNSITVDIK